MIEDIKFSVLVPAFKSRFLAECIESVLAQTYTHLELIIVNDASPENLDEIVARYDDRRIRYYVNEKNFGAVNVVGNWNKGLSYATGEYVICMGDDDKLLPCCLEEYRKLMEKYPGLGVYHGWTEMIDEKSEVTQIQMPRMEFEDVYSLMYFRFSGRVQYIGDFLFETKSLKARNGFYHLPLAWGSDDISGFLAADKGIANTQTLVFQYRINGETISKSGNTRMKVHSMIEYWKWVYEFLDAVPETVLKGNAVARCLVSQKHRIRARKLRGSLEEDLKNSPFGVCYWMRRRNVLEMSAESVMSLALKCSFSYIKKNVIR